MATVTVNDTPIRYEDSGGDGPAILFSHVDGAAHAPNMTHPDIVNDALRTFLASL